MARHGGPEDRGAADKWYGRAYNPHYFIGATRSMTEAIPESDMTPEQIADYKRGYENGSGKYD